jgi:hypothetical protein
MLKTKAAGSVLPVPHKGATGGRIPVDTNAAHVDSVAATAVEIDPSEIIVADATDDRGRLAEARRLIDEDRRRAGGKGTKQRDRLQEAVAPLGRHDLDENLADGEDRVHRSAHPVAAVDIVGLRNDVVSVFAGEERCQSANLIGTRHAAIGHCGANDPLLLARLQLLLLGEHRVYKFPVLVVDDAARGAVRDEHFRSFVKAL